ARAKTETSRRVVSEHRRPGPEWSTPLTSAERASLKRIVLQDSPGPAPDAAALKAAREQGDTLGARYGRDPWRAAAALGVPVQLGTRSPDAAAEFDPRSGTIFLAPEEGRVEAVASLAHELGHQQLGHSTASSSTFQREAEAHAFMRGFLGI
ncbi:MAG: hypothetical protein WC273_12600, partial [Dehalococcoidia bacterium]